MFYNVPVDQMERFGAALQTIQEAFGKRMYAADNLIALCRARNFQYNQPFQEAFSSTVRSEQEASLVWRLHTLTWAATQALSVEGDFAECGVLHGFSSLVVAKYLDFAKLARTFYLYDTFTGLTEDTSSANERKSYGAYAELDSERWLEDLKQRFSPFPNVRIVKGTVPNSFADACPEKIAFLHLDMNAAKAEIFALEHLFDRVSKGGVIILDDFGWDMHLVQTRNETLFFKSRGHDVLELPTGQGMVVKH